MQRAKYVKWINQEVENRAEIPECWKPIPGYEKYRISTRGNIENILTGRRMKTHVTRQGALVVALRRDGDQRTVNVRSLVWRAFMGDIPPGHRVIPKAMSKFDCSLDGLKLVSASEWGRIRGKLCGKPVIKIDPQGRVVEVYHSVTEAAERNAYTISGMAYRCRRSAKQTAPDGCDFAYDGDLASIHRALERLGIDWRTWKDDGSECL